MKKVKLSFVALAIIAALTMSFTNTIGSYTVVDPNHPGWLLTNATLEHVLEICKREGVLCAENENQSLQIEWDGFATKF